MRKHLMALALASAGLLTACGGGGSGNADTPSGSVVNVSGAAAKGRMSGADVYVHPVLDNGIVGLSTVLNTETKTDANGNYTLKFSGDAGKPYVIRVVANVNTTHLDEVTGVATKLPVGFTMRTVVTPAAGGAVTTSATVTPFSEMAVAAAAAAQGGLNPASTAQAVSTLTQLLGFDPTTVAVKNSADDTASDDELKLAFMLTAVAQMASTGALGCTDNNLADGDDRTKCVVEKLAASASLSSVKLEDRSAQGADTAGALAGAMDAVLLDDRLRGLVPRSAAAVIKGQLACVGVACNAAAPVASGTSASIAAAKQFLAQLKGDLISLFGSSGTTPSAFQVEANKFKAAMSGVQSPVEVLTRDVQAIIGGIDLLDTRSAIEKLVHSEANGTTVCRLFADVNATVVAMDPTTAVSVGCAVAYLNLSPGLGSSSATEVEQRQHVFRISPDANTPGAYAYVSSGRLRFISANGVQRDIYPAGTVAYRGSIATKLVGADLSELNIIGDLPGGISAGPEIYSNNHHGVNLIAKGDVANLALSVTGVVSTYKTATEVASTLTIARANLGAVGDLATAELSTIDLDVSLSTPGAKFEGTVLINGRTAPLGGGRVIPTQGTLTGVFSTITNGVATDVLTGTLSGTVARYASFDASKPADSTNYAEAMLEFTGTVTAPNRPKLMLTFATTQRNYETQDRNLTAVYKSFAAGSATPSRVVTVDINRVAAGTTSARLTEAISGITASGSGAPANIEIKRGAEVIGIVDRDTHLLTYKDGTVMSLDMGLLVN